MEGIDLYESMVDCAVEMIPQHDRIIVSGADHVDLNGISFHSLERVCLVGENENPNSIYAIEMVENVGGHRHCHFHYLDDVNTVFVYGKEGEIYNNIY